MSNFLLFIGKKLRNAMQCSFPQIRPLTVEPPSRNLAAVDNMCSIQHISGTLRCFFWLIYSVYFR